MSGESSRRSSLIDVTYTHLHSILSGHLEGVNIEHIAEYLSSRNEQLKHVNQPFGKPSEESRKRIESGSVTLADGVVLHVEEADKEFVFALSFKFGIGEIQSLVLLRSFLYNEGLPSTSETESTFSMVEELVEAITPFYFFERLSLFRVFIPLFRAKENNADIIHEISSEFLPLLLPEPEEFAKSIIWEYVAKTQENFPQKLTNDPKAATQWAKQNLKEQLVLLEVLFWTMWGYVSCSGPLVEKIYEAAYSTNLGSLQINSTLLLDEESTQLQQDCAALWIMIAVEVLELETLGERDILESISNPKESAIYILSPGSLEQIHKLIMTHGDSQYACIYLAWAYVLSRITAMNDENPFPASYHSFFESIAPQQGRSYNKDRVLIYQQMSKTCLEADVNFFDLVMSLLTDSPLFVTALAWKTGSTITDPNAIAFRSVLKGLLIALVELMPVEFIPNFDKFLEVWIALFGRSETQSITGICTQFWQADWYHGIARRAIFDVARSRFPIQAKPLIRLLRAMTGAGFLDTDPLSTADHSQEGEDLMEEREICDRYAFHYLLRLPTFSQAVPIHACIGAHALYERQQERYGSTNSSAGLTYVNLHPIRLPGGSILPARSTGRLLSGDGGDFLVICWQHEHNGWKVILELLTDYANRRRIHFGSSGTYQDVSFGRRDSSTTLALRLEDIGVEMNKNGDEELIIDALDLVRSLIQNNPIEAEQLMESLEAGEPVVAHTMVEVQPPDLVQLTTMILEEALSASANRGRPQFQTRLVTSAMSVLSALLVLPNYSNRVWLYIRSTSALFGSAKRSGFASVALGIERATGHYTMTLALLHLVQQLFREAASSIIPDNTRLQQLKEEVLLRATHFMNSEIWIEHLSWKYAQLGDRFEIGKRVTSFYVEVLEYAPPNLNERSFATLCQFVVDTLLFKASTSSVYPLVSSITSGAQTLRMFYASRRFGDARRLIFLLEAHLRLCRLLLHYKQKSNTKTSLLEQTLCARVTGGSASHDTTRTKHSHNPIDVLAGYVKDRDVGSTVPLESIRVLCVLCDTLSSIQPYPPTIISHLSNPESTVASLVRVIQHPYDDLSLRNSIWNFIYLAVDREPALASLFVAGKFDAPQEILGRCTVSNLTDDGSNQTNISSAMDVARDMLENWKGMWETNPQLLCSMLRFLDVVWKHGLEHKSTLAQLRADEQVWKQITGIACEEIGPVPDYDTIECLQIEGVRHSNLHESIAVHSYRTMVKSYAIHIIGSDIELHRQGLINNVPQKPRSFLAMESHLKSHEHLTDLLSEAAHSSYTPQLHDLLISCLNIEFPGLILEQLELQDPISERDYGDNFVFSTPFLRSRLHAYQSETNAALEVKESVEKQLMSVNINLSLTHAQTALADSWEFLLRKAKVYLRGNVEVRPIALTIAASISYDIAAEQRSGDMMASIHGTRLSLLLAILELAWFSQSDTTSEILSFMELVEHMPDLVLNEAQPPLKSILGIITPPFHRVILQIAYFCTKQIRYLLSRPKVLNAEQRLRTSSMIETINAFTIDGLRIVLVAARTRYDIDLDRDMELLVALFEQCTRRDICPSSTSWLTRCQETDIIRTSLDLYVHIDLVGLSDLPLLVSKKRSLYATHILLFHVALVSNPSAAERFASEGVLAAYSNNFVSAAISAGLVSVTLPELPGQRSPAHVVYVTMLSIVAAVISALGRHNHYFDAEACGFVQLYGDQIARTLSWTIGDQITMPLLEEIEQIVNLFYSLAASAPTAANTNPAVEKVLRVFTNHALQLLQQVNYAVTHPNHLASLFEPVTQDERVQFDKESSSEEPLTRPLISSLIDRLFRLSSNIVGTLIAISRADNVLLSTQEDWPLNEALLIPHSKVVLGEPASLGTLLELGNCTLDVLRDLVQKPIANKEFNTAVSLVSYAPASDSQRIITARRNLEEILLYGVTQLAMWLSKVEFDASLGDADLETEPAVEKRNEHGKERRGPRQSLSLAERVRRGMSGEMVGDLQSLLIKATTIVEKSNVIVGKDGVDMIPILLNFLHDRISTPT